jgi:hypothetical protein
VGLNSMMACERPIAARTLLLSLVKLNFIPALPGVNICKNRACFDCGLSSHF